MASSRRLRRPRSAAPAVLVLLLTGAGCQRPLAADGPQPVPTRHLPNVFRWPGSVLSGGLPAGEAAFAELAALGVRTVVSVDGATPDAETARRHGLRYVHLPHGYDRVPPERGHELAKAIRDLPGPVYLHCHHGRHRSPAAAAVACVHLGRLDPARAEQALRAAGTGPQYRGLYRSASAARPLAAEVLDRRPADLPAVAEVPPLAAAMVALEHRWGLVQRLLAGGGAAAERSRVAEELLLLREEYAELRRMPVVADWPPEFAGLLAAGEAAAGRLEAARLAGGPPQTLPQALAALEQNCRDCHRRFRD